MKHEMPVVPAELKEPLIRFLSDREARVEFSLEMYSRLHDLAEAIALAALRAKPVAYTTDAHLRFENELKIGDMWARPFDESVDVPLYRKPEV